MRSADTRAPETPRPNTRIKASDLLAKALENEGVEYIFRLPDEENLDFVESPRTSNIRLILTRDEQSTSQSRRPRPMLGTGPEP